MVNQQPDANQRLLLYYQIGLGAFATLLLAFGIWGYLSAGIHPFVVGMAIRVGVIMAVICLALPQLAGLRRVLPGIAIGFGVVAMILLAAKPKIGNILIGILAIALTANTALAWLASLTGKK